jgi:hypothetical protein
MPAAPLVVFRRYLIVVLKSPPRRRDAVAADKYNHADVQRKRVNFTCVQRRIIRMRVIMAAANCSPAIASRRAKYVDEFWVPTLLGAQSLDAQLL